MQEEKKTVDIDTSGPEVEVELPTNEDDKTAGEDKTHENERETKLEDNNQSDDSNKEFDKLPDVPVQEDKRQESNKKELDEYSDGVKRRIAKPINMANVEVSPIDPGIKPRKAFDQL